MSARLTLADWFTFASLVCGMLALALALSGMARWSGIALLVSVIADWLDGRIARKLDQSSRFGLYLDSLADICAFGFAPVAIALVLTGVSAPLLVAGALFLAAGAYRLARFQVGTPSGGFEGMPITANGVLFALALLFARPAWYALLFPAMLVACAALMASTFKVSKL